MQRTLFDVEAALALFAGDAVIDDVSVGEKFKSTTGVPKYIERFFIGYKTVNGLQSVEVSDNQNAKVRVDQTRYRAGS